MSLYQGLTYREKNKKAIIKLINILRNKNVPDSTINKIVRSGYYANMTSESDEVIDSLYGTSSVMSIEYFIKTLNTKKKKIHTMSFE